MFLSLFRVNDTVQEAAGRGVEGWGIPRCVNTGTIPAGTSPSFCLLAVGYHISHHLPQLRPRVDPREGPYRADLW